MARREIVVDDLDGTEGGEAFHFAVGDKSYVIDLSTKNIDAFNKAVAKYVEAAREVSGASGKRGSRKRNEVTIGPERSRAIREWATSVGREVSPKGRIPAPLIREYEAATGN